MDKFIPVTVEWRSDGSNPPVSDVSMLVNLRHVTFFRFPAAGPATVKLTDYSEMIIKNTEEEITQRINYPIIKKQEA